MMWLADVLTGTTSQQWEKRYRAVEVAGDGLKRPYTTRISGGVRRSWTHLREWFQRRRDKHVLSQLSDHLLRDIGISRVEIHEYVENRGVVRSTESTVAPEPRVGKHTRYVVAGTGPIVQQCVVQSGAISCANDELERVA